MTATATPLPATRDQIAALIPHQGGMCLLDEVKEATADTVVCISRSYSSPDNPLRRAGRLPAVALCEYGAQAMAVHGGMATQASGQRSPSGWLVALRDVQLNAAFVEAAGELEVTARRLAESDAAWQYEFAVTRAGRLLASGRATVALKRTQ
ncbi:MAG: phosphotransferase [Steroidobacteraceae bacterium]